MCHKILSLALTLFLISRAADVPNLHLSCGPVQGTQTPYANVYYSIPFARPPVGDLRWQPAEPANCWNGVLNGTEQKSICYQIPGSYPLPESEDCLHLDVYSPKKPTQQLLPILFWIYGGSNIEGYTTSYWGLDYLAQALNVILVAPNYRLGTLGFLALKELSQRDKRGVSGNYAITDLILALKWTQKEAHNIGGDPNQVTLLGQSSGGTNILSLLSSREAQPLFHRAISLSASPNISMSLQQAETQHKELLLPALGCRNEDVLKCLLAKDPESLSKNLPLSFQENSGVPNKKSGMDFAGLAIADGVTVESVLDTFRDPAFDTGKTVIFQAVYGEIFPLFVDPAIANETKPQYEAMIRSMYTSSNGWAPTVAEGLSQLYRNELTQPLPGYVAWSVFTADVFFLGGNAILALEASKAWKSSKIYLSTFVYPPSEPFCLSDPKYKATIAFHLWDYMLAANNFTFLDPCGDEGPFVPSQLDLQVGQTLVDQWKAIAYNGSFSGSSVNWDQLTPENKNIAVLSETIQNQPLDRFREGVILKLTEHPYSLNQPIYWFVN